MTPAELVAYYQDLLIIQYNNLPNAMGMVGDFVAELVADSIMDQVRNGFDPDTAVGKQLEAVASYKGARRTYYGIDIPRPLFTMPAYGAAGASTANGFALYGGIDIVTWYFATYGDLNLTSVTLTDDELRALTKYLADVQASDFGLESIDDILFKYFGNFVTLTDNEDMTITYTHLPADPGTLYNIVSQVGLLPHPAGVGIILA